MKPGVYCDNRTGELWEVIRANGCYLASFDEGMYVTILDPSQGLGANLVYVGAL